MRFKWRFIIRLIEGVAFISAACGATEFVLYKLNMVCMSALFTRLDIFDMYYTQISVSFIIISLVSVLTNVSKPVYWVDITQFKLIEPRHTAFIDFAAYIFGGLILSSIFIIFSSNYIIISFGFSILFMMALTIKMIGAYFGRDSVKVELQKEFLSLKDKVKNANSDRPKEIEKNNTNQKTKYKRKEKEDAFKALQTYTEICSELEDKTYQEIDNKEYKLVSENLDLLISCDEYDIVIDILRYIGENMVNIYCKYAKKYLRSIMDYKPDDYSQEHQNRFFQLAYTNLMRSIDENDLREVSVCLYSILLKGRNAQFTQDELKNKRIYTRGQYWKRIVPFLSDVYKKCISENKYDLLDEFLYSFYKEQLAFRRMLSSIRDNNTEIVGRLYTLYFDNLGLEAIIQGLCEKVCEDQIEQRQINMLLESLTKIYHELEVNRDKNKEAICSEQLSRKIYDKNFVELIKVTYEKKLLDEKMSKKYAVKESNELQSVYNKIISE
jgi:hypothetical protein